MGAVSDPPAVGIGGRVSGHSLRVGGAQSLAVGGASLVELQTAGRWQSPSESGSEGARSEPRIFHG